MKLDLPLLTKCFDILKCEEGWVQLHLYCELLMPESRRTSQEKDFMILLVPYVFPHSHPKEAVLFHTFRSMLGKKMTITF